MPIKRHPLLTVCVFWSFIFSSSFSFDTNDHLIPVIVVVVVVVDCFYEPGLTSSVLNGHYIAEGSGMTACLTQRARLT